jgi:hypothetical protein
MPASSMPQDALTRANLRTPKAAAVAGILFSILLLAIFWLFRSAVPADPFERGAWIVQDVGSAALALNLVPFAGVAFLWFIGVLRDRLGQLEDRFFATVFFGSGLLFLSMLFAAAAMIGALIMVAASVPSYQLIDSPTFHLARSLAYLVVNVYAVKMAGVFMLSSSTVIIKTRIAPRWIAILGFVLGLLVLFGSYYLSWSVLVFPLWVLILSAYILTWNLSKE